MSPLPGPEDVLGSWLGDTPVSPAHLDTFNRQWFRRDEAFDATLRERFLGLLETLSAGPLADDWASRGAHGRLGAIIVLDQFSRNIFRATPRAFAQDGLALRLAMDGLDRREDLTLSEPERVFFYLPLEHAERADHQARSVALFDALNAAARPGYAAFTASTLTYARLHADAIARFGRFPHRNAVVGRASTPDEAEWLAAGGGF